MNQILATEPPKNNKTNNNNPINIKKIIVFFSCAILILGATIIGVSIYKMRARNNDNKTPAKPVITLKQVDNKIRITAEYEGGISKLVYYWNEAEKIEETQEGTTIIDKLIDIPRGEDTLKVEIVDMQGNVTPFDKTFEGLKIADGDTSIGIDLVQDNTKIEIVAENSAGLKYIKYKLNDGKEVQVDSNEENPNIIEIAIDLDNLEIVRGDNIFSVIAVDFNDNETEQTSTIQGKNKPIISVIQNGNSLDCEISHDMGFKKIEFNFNGKVFAYDENHPIYDETLTTFKTSIPLVEGERNRLIITAYSIEGTEEKFKGEKPLNVGR